MNTFYKILVISFFVFASRVYPHEKSHETHHPTVIKESQDPSKLEQINTLYSQSVKSIFENKCLNCHGGVTNFPWYYRLPIAKQLINRDVREAKKHLDMSRGFPFEGHGTPLDDLKAIEKATKEKSMPPFRYWIMHQNSSLTEKEQEEILNWVTQSLEILQIQ